MTVTWVWQQYVAFGQWWTAAIWFVAGWAWYLFTIISQCVTATLLAKWWWRGRAA